MEFFNLTMLLMSCFLTTNYCCSFIRIIVVKMLRKAIVTDLTSCKSGPPDSLPGCDQPLLEGYHQGKGQLFTGLKDQELSSVQVLAWSWDFLRGR